MRFVTRNFLAIAVSTVLALAGCISIGSSSKDLTRPKALSLINAAKKLVEPTTQVAVTRECYDMAKRDGFFLATWKGDQLTPKASEYFTQYWFFAGTAQLKTPLKRRAIEVTGIKDGPMQTGTKEAEFKWEYVGTPEFVNKYTGTTAVPHEGGEALLRLYDDGWRVEEIHIR